MFLTEKGVGCFEFQKICRMMNHDDVTINAKRCTIRYAMRNSSIRLQAMQQTELCDLCAK